jgi:hypothetical protein
MYGRAANKGHRSLVAGAAWIFAIAMFAGCGGDSFKEYDELETSKIATLVGTVAQAMTDQKHFDEIFAPGTGPTPARRKELFGYMFFTQGKDVKIDGNTATFPVDVKNGNTSDIVVTVEWTAEKSGNTWRLTTCPIPAEVKPIK